MSPQKHLSTYTIAKRISLGICAPLFALFAACESTPSPSPDYQATSQATPQAPRDQAAKAVPSANVKKVEAWRDASMLASRSQGREALVGGGESMNPVYGDNTMLVIHPIDFNELKVGMTVVYVNRYGRRVAHQLIKKEAKGWRAQGLNNAEEDSELVTPANILGVVYASLSSEIP